jgi:RNA polymerase nonessential primary-like sigma factor
MLKANLKLVVKIVNRYNAKNVDKFDLIQAAIEKGLKKAIEKFDPELGYKFSTYSVWWF